MRFATLGTGSAGNSFVVEHEGSYLLIDAGFSARELDRRLRALEVDPAKIHSILLTHEHGDHTKGLNNFCKSYTQAPVLTSSLTRRSLEAKMPAVRWLDIERGSLIARASFLIESFALIHDAADPLGFLLRPQSNSSPDAQAPQSHAQPQTSAQPQHPDQPHHPAEQVNSPALGLLLDCGKAPQAALQKLRGVSTLILEANYDEALLAADSKRPASIKARIAGRHGHLSNKQAAEVITQLQPHGLQTVILGHLSQDCNNPATALQTIRQATAGTHPSPVRLHCASQAEPSPWIEVKPPAQEIPLLTKA